MVQNPSSLYSFSNATSFSDFYNFVEEEQLVTPTGEVLSKNEPLSENSMQKAEKKKLEFRYLANYDFKRKNKHRIFSGRSVKSVISRKST